MENFEGSPESKNSQETSTPEVIQLSRDEAFEILINPQSLTEKYESPAKQLALFAVALEQYHNDPELSERVKNKLEVPEKLEEKRKKREGETGKKK